MAGSYPAQFEGKAAHRERGTVRRLSLVDLIISDSRASERTIDLAHIRHYIDGLIWRFGAPRDLRVPQQLDPKNPPQEAGTCMHKKPDQKFTGRISFITTPAMANAIAKHAAAQLLSSNAWLRVAAADKLATERKRYEKQNEAAA